MYLFRSHRCSSFRVSAQGLIKRDMNELGRRLSQLERIEPMLAGVNRRRDGIALSDTLNFQSV